MKTIVFCSFKGGTSKTSTSLNLGAALSKFHDKKVLLIDFDAQVNLSEGLGVGAYSSKTIASVLRGERKVGEVIKKTNTVNLFVIPGSVHLDGIESTEPLVSDLYAHERLRKAINGLSFDYCFIDTPPSLGWLSRAAFCASQKSIICIAPEPYSILALNRLKDFHENEVNEYHDVDCFGVVFNFWDFRGATNNAFIDAVSASFPGRLFKTRIRRDITVSRAILEGKSVFEFDKKSKAAKDFKDLSDEFLQLGSLFVKEREVFERFH